jgi:hypothetical protein
MSSEIDPNDLSFARPIRGATFTNAEAAAKDVLAGMLEHLRNLRSLLKTYWDRDETKAMIRRRIREHHANIRAHCDEHNLPMPPL